MFQIERLPHGGYLVRGGMREQGYENVPLFAATDVNEALVYLAQRLDPPAEADDQR